MYLTHIGHELDRWLQTQTLLPENVHAAYDRLALALALQGWGSVGELF
ncbi:hypothetical protein [Pectobacterium carotovorum]|nr:hypothetical protein [Pectobacterium carotovorum]